ncbi:MAG: IPT/TIG domain-containing protein [Thermoanaerobaculia bacterium]
MFTITGILGNTMFPIDGGAESFYIEGTGFTTANPAPVITIAGQACGYDPSTSSSTQLHVVSVPGAPGGAAGTCSITVTYPGQSEALSNAVTYGEETLAASTISGDAVSPARAEYNEPHPEIGIKGYTYFPLNGGPYQFYIIVSPKLAMYSNPGAAQPIISISTGQPPCGFDPTGSTLTQFHVTSVPPAPYATMGQYPLSITYPKRGTYLGRGDFASVAYVMTTFTILGIIGSTTFPFAGGPADFYIEGTGFMANVPAPLITIDGETCGYDSGTSSDTQLHVVTVPAAPGGAAGTYSLTVSYNNNQSLSLDNAVTYLDNS